MSQIASDEFPWITSEFFEKILIKHDVADAKVIDFVLSEAVAKGANYGSQMVRVLVNYNSGSDLKHKSFVIKTGFTNQVMDASLLDLFKREIVVYRDILPKFQKYLDKIDPNFKCAPKCYQVSEDPLYFVFEDLKDEQFTNLDRHAGLTFDATAMVLKKLATLHAINAQLYEDSPELFEIFKKQMFDVNNSELVKQLTCGLRDCKNVCLKWPGYEQFSGKIQHFLDNIGTIIGDAYDTANDDTFTTLIHGDLWVNNIMYKFDETTKNAIDVIMVDYQIGYYGSPALDLSYLFYTSTINEICEIEWDRLLQIYHGELVKSLKLIDYRKRIPTLSELQIQMLKRSAYALVLSFLIFRHIDNSDDANIDIMLGDSEKALKVREQLLEKPHVKKRIQYLMDFYGRKGFFFG